MNRRTFLAAVALCALALPSLAGCSSGSGSPGSGSAGYERVGAETAKDLMDETGDRTVLDVRTRSEYDEGHIPGTVLLPHDAVTEEAEGLLPDKDRLILVYCRSGNRSKQAAQALVDLGYTQVVEFGGINDWPYGIER